MGNKLNREILKKLTSKGKEVEKVFTQHYNQVSNQKFNFSQFDHLFNKILNITYKDFIELSQKYQE